MSRRLTRSPEDRARRLLRWYPVMWRQVYGPEFVALLEAEIVERPRCLRRAIDVARAGLMARIAAIGFGHNALVDESKQIRVGLGALSCCVVLFLACAVALWSQLTIGWQWSAPSSGGARITMTAMTVLLPMLLGLTLIATAPVAVAAARAICDGRGGELRLGVALTTIGAAVLIVGSCLFDHGWPGTGGHAWADRALMPGGPASVLWAATLSISSYWAHPARLGTFPAIEIAWMVVAPLAIGCVAWGMARTIRRLELSPRVLRFEHRLALLAAVVMIAAVAGGCLWVLGNDPGPRHLFAIGAINTMELAGMAVASGAALSLARRTAARA